MSIRPKNQNVGASAAAAEKIVKPMSAPNSTRSRGRARRADSSAAESEPIAITDPSSPYSLAPRWNTVVDMSAMVIWKFIPKVPSMNTTNSSSLMSLRPRT